MPFVECVIRSFRYRVKRFVIAVVVSFLYCLCSRRGLDPTCRPNGYDTVYPFDRETSQQLRPTFCQAFVPFPLALHLLPVSIPPCSHWQDPKSGSIDDDTVDSFDRQPSQQLRPTFCHVSSPIRSTLRLLLVSIDPSSSHWQDPKSGSNDDDTEYSFEGGASQQLRPNVCQFSVPPPSASRPLLASIDPSSSSHWQDPKSGPNGYDTVHSFAPEPVSEILLYSISSLALARFEATTLDDLVPYLYHCCRMVPFSSYILVCECMPAKLAGMHNIIYKYINRHNSLYLSYALI
jgi:hypothetical protein